MIHNINFMLLETVWQVFPVSRHPPSSSSSSFLHLLTNRESTCQCESQFNGVTVNQRAHCRQRFLPAVSVCHGPIFIYLPQKKLRTNKMSHFICARRGPLLWCKDLLFKRRSRPALRLIKDPLKRASNNTPRMFREGTAEMLNGWTCAPPKSEA